ncbi:MAG TPA: putative cytokinetic ring protein SteA [Actinomycetota bacterium]|nr:putative cytokinetic ring protein SteA [Actinomycetota bacterium]
MTRGTAGTVPGRGRDELASKLLRLRTTRPRGQAGGRARVDHRTKDLVSRIQPGDVAVIDHEDLDRVAAEALVRAGVGAVVNAAPSISGRYPNLGPKILEEAGIPLIDRVGPLVLQKVREGDPVRLEDDRLFAGDRLLAVGVRQDRISILRDMESAREAVDERFEGFARNTLEYMREERDLLFGGAGLPELRHSLAGRHVLVVVRGYGYREDLAALRSYIRDVKPVLVGVDGGADALLDAGYRPDVVVGDMDSISDRALALIQRPRRVRTDIVLHAYLDGRAPGRARLERLGIPHVEVRSAGTSEDVAFLLAHERRAELIVAVGTHGNLREFLDKGRPGMSSTFLVRLRVGEILMDAKGVARLYPRRARARDVALLVGAVLVAFGLMLAASPALRLYLVQTLDGFVEWVRSIA